MMTKADHIRRLYTDPIYAIMGEELSLGRKNLDVAKELIAAGVKIIQYREKHKTWREKYAEAKAIAGLCHDADVTFIMNDSTDLAIACGADGIHVGQDDAPAPFVHELAGADIVVGVSTNTIADIQQAKADGADYVGFGPIFPTASKKDTHPVVTAKARAYAVHVDLPVAAIGGIHLGNIRALWDEGFRSFAMISEIVSQPDIAKAVYDLRKALQ